jgi:hypothetical protein
VTIITPKKYDAMLVDPTIPAVVLLIPSSSEIAGRRRGRVALPNECETIPADATAMIRPHRIESFGTLDS